MTTLFNTVCIIGVGLMGGSLARTIKKHSLAKIIIGTSRNRDHLQEAVQLGVIDKFETDLAKAVADADLIVLATPVGASEKVLQAIKSAIKPSAIITDLGSTKQSVADAMVKVFGNVPDNAVLAHPIAGTEQSGVAASFAELYQERRVILTPVANTNTDALQKITAFWQACGAEVINMEITHHDEVLAATSHLPHVIAYAMVNTLAHMNDKQEIFNYAAGGFKDFTRIASSDPTMWLDICLANKAALLKAVKLFKDDLDKLTVAIEADDKKVIHEMFSFAKQSRDAITDADKSN